MARAEDSFKLTITQNVIDVLNTSRGRSFTSDELKAIAAGQLHLIAPIGCLKFLGYADDGQSLSSIGFEFLFFTIEQIKNLNDFRDQFEAAVNHGHSVAFVFNEPEKRMSSMKLFPCECQCGTKTPLTPRTSAEPPEQGPLGP